MPCMTSVVIMAKELGADEHLAVGNVFVSTIISILTLPVVVMAINRFLYTVYASRASSVATAGPQDNL
jgi:predicted Na+-dependent transporter